MHKLCEFIDRELEELEEKAEKDGQLSRSEIDYGKDLAKFKMALLTNEAMERDGGESGFYPYMGYRSYDGDGGSMRGGRSYAQRRNANGRYSRESRESRGGYSREDARESMVADLRELMQEAPDDNTKKMFQNFIRDIENS